MLVTLALYVITLKDHFFVSTYRSFSIILSEVKICCFSGQILKDLKCYDFIWLQLRHNCSPAASFTNCVMTQYLLKVHLQTFPSVPLTQKCLILSCETFVANERYVSWKKYCYISRRKYLKSTVTCTLEYTGSWNICCTKLRKKTCIVVGWGVVGT
jgi:hypothetical protein